MANHPDNIRFTANLKKLIDRMKGNDAEPHYLLFHAYSTQIIYDQGGIINDDTYVIHCDSKIGIPQYGKCNHRVYTEVLRGTDQLWVELQKKWNTPLQYIRIMEKSINETETLCQWWDWYPRIYGDKYKKKQNFK
eukprot:862246_1